MAELRPGLGVDLHPADPGRVLFLGGVRFDGEPGLRGHSDGDVVCHALADALLGAAALGDLGTHFRDTDPSVEGIAGLDLLGRVVAQVDAAGFGASSCDVVVIAEQPTIAPRAAEMRDNLARVLEIRPHAVSIKATRPEGLTLAGQGAACLAVAVLLPR